MRDEKKKTLADFRPQEENANLHTQRGRGLLEKSMERDGYSAPMVAANDGEVFIGSHRLEVAGEVFDSDVEPIIIESDGKRPVIVKRTDIENADDPKARRLGLADNRIAELSLEWDKSVLESFDMEDLDLVGFRAKELESMGVFEPENVDAEPQTTRAEELQLKWGVERGDLWQIGEHRLICGDCTDPDVVARVMGGEKCVYGMHDPPYGIEVVSASTDGGGKPFGKGRIGFDNTIKANSYAAVEGDDELFDPEHLLDMSEYCFLWGANYYADKLHPMKGWVVWDKKRREGWRDNFSDCELAWTNIKTVTRIFRHTWLGMVQEGEREKRYHPTQKPVALYVKIMKDLFKDDGAVIDCYVGAGVTLLACQNLGRKGRGVEISPAYVAVCLQRMSDAFPDIEISKID